MCAEDFSCFCVNLFSNIVSLTIATFVEMYASKHNVYLFSGGAGEEREAHTGHKEEER